jgi:hypothetical protein
VQAFVANLREAARDCKFGDLHDDLIFDQLIYGLLAGKVREQLLLQSELNLKRAIQVATQTETAMEDEQTLGHSAGGDGIKKVFKGRQQPQQRHHRQQQHQQQLHPQS